MLTDWLNGATIIRVGLILFLSMMAAAYAGYLLQRWQARRTRPEQDETEDDTHEGYIVSAVLGLLALLLGFTFAMSIDRYETRRALVLEESNAIGTAYLRAQLLDEPHRERLSGLLTDYAENRLALGKAEPGDLKPLLARNDALVTDLWAATAAGFDSVKHLDFSTALVDSMNLVIDLDASRKTAHMVRVPTQVFVVLFFYLLIAAGVLGYTVEGRSGWIEVAFLFMLLTVSLMLIVDIDRPAVGAVREAQGPMERLVKSLQETPASSYDRWRTAPAR